MHKMLVILSFVLFFAEISFSLSVTTAISADTVLCDPKNFNDSKDGKKLCKVECYTKLGNPGVCQTLISNACRTVGSIALENNCEKNKDISKHPMICCPFETEKQMDSVVEENGLEINIDLKKANNNSLHQNKDCGQRPDIQAIVGGIDSQPNTWPWIVSIHERQTPNSSPNFICGGAIINNKYILSAAHCFFRRKNSSINPRKYLIKYGAHKLSDRNIKYREVSKVVIHEDYNGFDRYNDIALLKLKDIIEFNPTVGPICLPEESLFLKSFVGNKTTVIGWGSTYFTGYISDPLQEVQVDVIDNKECNRNYSKLDGHQLGFPLGINSNLMCAGLKEGGKDSCQGDSGGPLAISIDDKWYELGIVSFGYKCAEKGFPGIYTRIKPFIDWITTNTK